MSIAGLGIGAATAVDGYSNKKKAEEAAKSNVLKKYKTSQSEYDNLALLESRAGSGMGDAARTAFQNNADRGLSAGISAILRGGGDVNAVGGLYDNYINGMSNMAIYDDKRNVANMDNLISGRQRIANSQDKEYQLNEYLPWANKAQAYAQQAAAGQQQMWSGINTAGGALMGGISALGRQGSITNDSGNRPASAPPFGAGKAAAPAGPTSAGFNPFGGQVDASGMNSYGGLYNQAWASPSGLNPSDLMSMDAGQKQNLYSMWLQGQQHNQSQF